MTRPLSRVLPDRLAARIVLLLAMTLLAAHLVALVILDLQHRRFDRQASRDREIERIAALIPAMEAVDAPLRRAIAREASTRFARVRVSAMPLLRDTAPDDRAKDIAARMRDTLDREDVRVGLLDRRPWDDARGRHHGHAAPVIAISVPLSARDGQSEWLNVVTRSGPARPVAVDRRPFLTVLALSLIGVLIVSILLARHLARPLEQLARAAEAAGRGDRHARVPERGAREIRRAAHAFNAMQHEIARFDAERMRMLAAVGHDLRTPMTSLRLRAEMVEDDAQRTAMTRTLDEMAEMADGLIRYAKHGTDLDPPEPVALAPLLAQICADRGAAFHAEAEIRLPARPVALGRAIGNLVDNARRYGGAARVTLARGDGAAIITVDDDGPGIAPARIEALFQPFARGEDSRNRDTGGVGLGLSIARGIIVAHGGEITLANRPEGGLRATVRLPFAPPATR